MDLEEIRVPKLLALLIENVISSNKAIVLTSHKLMSDNDKYLKIISEELHLIHTENVTTERQLESVGSKLNYIEFSINNQIENLENRVIRRDRQITKLKNAVKKKGKK